MKSIDFADAIQDPIALKHEFDQQGYVVVRQALPSELVQQAYNDLMDILTLSSETPRLLGRKDIMALPSVQRVLEHDHLYHLVESVLGCHETNVFTLPYKWLRVIQKGEYTGPHIDRIYFPSSKWPRKMLTIWIPFMTTRPEMGAMTVSPQSHIGDKAAAIHSFYKDKQVGKDLTTSGWICPEADQVESRIGFAPCWQSTVFERGDVCILSMDTLHMTVPNATNQWRISCDTRWLYLE